MEKYEVNKTLELFETKIKDLENALDLDAINNRLKEIEPIMANPNFWNDSNQAKKISQELNQLTEKKQTITSIQNQYEDALMWLEEAKEGTESWDILEAEIDSLQKKISEFEIEVLLNGEYDHNNAILELHPGAGGTESMDWCGILMRMYERFAGYKGYKVEILNYLAGEEAGVKSVTLRISGPYAYGNLKSERGVHRLVRISPFDSNKRRHTSFVSCDVAPEIDETSEVELKDDDIRMDTFQSSGAGGQSVNTTYSAVRLTHIPTGIVVNIQNERSQIKNKEAAMQILKSKLIQKELEEKQAKLNALKGEKSDIGWGSQIRSYVFQPYQMVKDHRTNYEVGNIQSVMDGDIDGFINAYLKSKAYE
ncbi:peptide chain release factor 2 [Acholeplasma laidlawii]|uniref:Peptide chain release factor 2 n=2 Tax=Acholeplasma laidlawii TaxID=2148 RepID=RF2_ACHLI|nr:peptide chain release factor 2 [Acholeplasma laidlawii]A9NF23.1 RecName: Full=Peptide chain release factor 2; Short=RF-2 [Acholeplasma laidlawii PG-8A]ABX80953.1 peptide chain release factor RF-2 [Acholeplasma laidlawii PG-8A]NWH10482.1 peptide chain release factor 2 [Acholeplasma laidlawii]NWH11870.1 peptide chain release factor 2 [Acholeplasma laidlawii]NWH12722.1 peptide chain release factor 2 [Acholeplasma laidlawii]NWH13899.1 peptide chain release factor 2 [Acholeplasma laidlawii]